MLMQERQHFQNIYYSTLRVSGSVGEYNVPVFFFINKLDKAGADKERVIAEIKKELTEKVCYTEVSIKDNEGSVNFTDQLIEFISEQDDELLERYFDGNYDEELWKERFKALIKERKVFPSINRII